MTLWQQLLKRPSAPTEEGLEDLESILSSPPPSLEAPLRSLRSRSSSGLADLTSSCTLPATSTRSTPAAVLPSAQSLPSDPGHLAASCPDLGSRFGSLSSSVHDGPALQAGQEVLQQGRPLERASSCHSPQTEAASSIHAPDGASSSADLNAPLDSHPSSLQHTDQPHAANPSDSGHIPPGHDPQAATQHASGMATGSAKSSMHDGLGHPQTANPRGPSPAAGHGLIPDPRFWLGHLQQQGEGIYRVATGWQSLAPWARRVANDAPPAPPPPSAGRPGDGIELQQNIGDDAGCRQDSWSSQTSSSCKDRAEPDRYASSQQIPGTHVDQIPGIHGEHQAFASAHEQRAQQHPAAAAQGGAGQMGCDLSSRTAPGNPQAASDLDSLQRPADDAYPCEEGQQNVAQPANVLQLAQLQALLDPREWSRSTLAASVVGAAAGCAVAGPMGMSLGAKTGVLAIAATSAFAGAAQQYCTTGSWLGQPPSKQPSVTASTEAGATDQEQTAFVQQRQQQQQQHS